MGCRASTTEEDGTFFVFLEDVDETLMVRYITEGELLGIHCKLSEETPPYFMAMPYCTFKRRDDTSLLRGEKVELTFGLLPTTVLIQGGHRLRVAIAGAARDTFARIPTTGAKSLQVSLRRHLASYIRLPVVS